MKKALLIVVLALFVILLIAAAAPFYRTYITTKPETGTPSVGDGPVFNGSGWSYAHVTAGLGGPGASEDTEIAIFDGTDGDMLKGSGVTIDTSGNITTSGDVSAGNYGGNSMAVLGAAFLQPPTNTWASTSTTNTLMGISLTDKRGVQIYVGSGLEFNGSVLSSTGGNGVSDGDKGDVNISANGTVFSVQSAAPGFSTTNSASVEGSGYGEVGLTDTNDVEAIIRAPDAVSYSYKLILPPNVTNGVMSVATDGTTNGAIRITAGVTGNYSVLVAGGTTNLFQLSNGLVTNVVSGYYSP